MALLDWKGTPPALLTCVFRSPSKISPQNPACPDGTVPIQRTTKDDLVRAKNISNQMLRNSGCHNPLPPNIHVNNGDIGCFNLLCAGFVQVDRTVYPGIRLAPVSIVGGQTYETKFTIDQDPHTQNWWFTLTDENITVGYWPKEIFTHLRNGADEVGWGGTAMSGNTLSPPVGSGRYPDGNISHAAYFRSLHYVRAWLKELYSNTD